jgi:hypothetical protein
MGLNPWEAGLCHAMSSININASDPASLAQRALSHVQAIAKTGRGSATPAEKQAADYVQAQLENMGITDIEQHPFYGERSLWLFVALVLGLALVGHAAYWLLRGPAGNLPAIIITVFIFGLSSYLIWGKFTLQDYPLKNLLPHGASQNVIAKIPPAGEAQCRVVLVAHLDSHRAVFWFATDTLVRIFTPIAMLTLFGVFLAIPLYVLAVITHMQAFAWFGLSLAFFHFLGWFTGVTADLGPYSPGANDNASSVGTLLAIAERLKAHPLKQTEIWLAFTGCEETSGDGALALIRQYGEQLKEAVFIDFEMVGIGDVIGYIREEGNISRYTIPAELEALIKDVGQSFGIQSANGPMVGAATECSIFLKHKYKAACIIAYRHGHKQMAEWHRLTDIPDHLELASLERVQKFAWELLHRLDQ